MSTSDLNLLADVLAFAGLVALGGLIVTLVDNYAVESFAWTRQAIRRTLRIGVSIAALVAVSLAGVAVWPATREGVNAAVGVDLDARGDAVTDDDSQPAPGAPDLEHSSVAGQPGRVGSAASVRKGGALVADGTPLETAGSPLGGGSGGTGTGGGGGGTGGGGGGGGTGGGGGGGGGGGWRRAATPVPTSVPTALATPVPAALPGPVPRSLPGPVARSLAGPVARIRIRRSTRRRSPASSDRAWLGAADPAGFRTSGLAARAGSPRRRS